MACVTQKEILEEASFLDTVRATAAATKAAVLAVAPELGTDLKNITEPFTSAYNAFKSQRPLSVLKDLLKQRTDIELVDVLKEEQRTANPNKSWFREITGPKNVTLITFTANVYTKGTSRKYIPYTEAVSTKATQTTAPTTAKPKVQKPKTPPVSKPKPSKQPPKPDEQPSKSLNREENLKTLTAEIFRTSKGLQVGEIYDTQTGKVFYSERAKLLPVFNDEIIRYRDNRLGGYPLKNILAFLTKVTRITDNTAKNIIAGAANLQDLVTKATGVPITAGLDTLIPDNKIDKLRDILKPIYVENKQYRIAQLCKTPSQLDLLNDGFFGITKS